MRKGMLFVALVLAMGLASANDKGSIDVTDGVSFADQRDRVLAQMADGETYAEISAGDRNKVVAALQRIEHTLDDGGSSATLTANERVQLMNDQELVNNILTMAGEDSRMVCKREAPVGSRLAKRQCMTVAERRRQREEAQNNMDRELKGMEGIFTR